MHYRSRFPRIGWFLWTAAVLLLCGSALAQENTAQQIIRDKVQPFWTSGEIRLDDSLLTSAKEVAEFYGYRDFKPAWTNPAAGDDLISAIRSSEEDGLNPADYHLQPIEELRKGRQSQHSADLAAHLDLLMTDAVFTLSRHLFFGKVDPRQLFSEWNMPTDSNAFRPHQVIQEGIDSAKISALIDTFRPKHPYYTELKQALKAYRAIAAQGGWGTIPAPEPSLKKGVKDSRVALIRHRLALTGDLERYNDSDYSTTYDDQLVQAVQRFQRRHGLNEDGVIGKGTIEAMNVPVDYRVDQIIANLERGRWMLHEVSGKMVIVNIAGYILYYTDGEGTEWQTRIQVGQPYRRTPVIRSRIDHLVFNPTWRIPPTILEKDTLPAIKKNRAYLQKHNLRIIDFKGREISPGSVRWAAYKGRDFPYMLEQKPGAKNSLGRVKFMFPNEHDVYLHDTPHKSLFDKSTRTFSSGCIRVENPLHLVDLLLDDRDWNQEKIDRLLRSKKTVTVPVKNPVPILLFYWTAQVLPNGDVLFLPDVYGHDHAILGALRGEASSDEGKKGGDLEQAGP